MKSKQKLLIFIIKIKRNRHNNICNRVYIKIFKKKAGPQNLNMVFDILKTNNIYTTCKQNQSPCLQTKIKF